MPRSDMSLEEYPSKRRSRTVMMVGSYQRRAADPGDPVHHRGESVRPCAAVVADPLGHRAGCALANLPPVGQVDAAHPGLRGELDELCMLQFALGSLPQSVLLLRQYGDGAALRGVVGHAGQLSRVSELSGGLAGPRQKRRCLPVADGDRAGFLSPWSVSI